MNDRMTYTRRIYRSRDDRMLAGVAGGLGQYFNVDPVLFRLGFALLTLTTGVGLLAYIVLAIVTPTRPLSEAEPVITSSVNLGAGREMAGYLLVGVGLLWLASNLGLFGFINWNLFWPILLIAGGVALLARHVRG